MLNWQNNRNEEIPWVGALHLDGKNGIMKAFSSGTHFKPGLHFPQSPEIEKQAPHVSPSSLNSGPTF